FQSLLLYPVGEYDLRTFLQLTADEEDLSSADFSTSRLWLQTWFGCLAGALCYMHETGVRHQDIKPSNIIHRGRDVYFTDFSSADKFELGGTTSTENPASTTAMYAAPETLHDGDEYQRHGLATDVFSLGCVFIEMLAVLAGSTVDELQDWCFDQSGSK
ncbi:kinase-like protein, partial [Patellaria atrata CBS 101060]